MIRAGEVVPYAGLVTDQIVVGVICAMLPRPALVAATPPYDVAWPPEVAALMEWCWSEERGDRPSFDLVLERLEPIGVRQEREGDILFRRLA